MKRCPLCGARLIGRIGRDRYYCRECCHEWTGGQCDIKIYKILSDGTIASLQDGAEDESRGVERPVLVTTGNRLQAS